MDWRQYGKEGFGVFFPDFTSKVLIIKPFSCMVTFQYLFKNKIKNALLLVLVLKSLPVPLELLVLIVVVNVQIHWSSDWFSMAM